MYQDFKQVFFNIIKLIEEDKESRENTISATEEATECLELGNKSILWIVGGPGSKKFDRVCAAMSEYKNWKVISTGEKYYVFNKKVHYFSSKDNCFGII